MAQTPSIPKGTRDYSPEVMVKRNYIFDTIKSVFKLYGYLPLETPAMENLSTLMGKYWTPGISWHLSPIAKWRNAIFPGWPTRFARRDCVTTWPCLSPDSWYNTKMKYHSRSSATRFNPCGGLTVRRRDAIASSTSVTWMSWEVIPCWTRWNWFKSWTRCTNGWK